MHYFLDNLCILAMIFLSTKSAVFLLFYSLFPGSPQGNLCTHVGTLLDLFAIKYIAILDPDAHENHLFDEFWPN